MATTGDPVPGKGELKSELYDVPRVDREMVAMIGDQLKPLHSIVDRFGRMAPIPMAHISRECEGYMFTPKGESASPVIIITYGGAFRAVVRQGPLDELRLSGLNRTGGVMSWNQGVAIENNRIVQTWTPKGSEPLSVADIEGKKATVVRSYDEGRQREPAGLMVVFFDCAAGTPGKRDELVYAANILGPKK